MLGAPQVAVVGLACRFPGAAHLGAFWALLRAGRSALGPAPPGRRLPAQGPQRGGFLSGPRRFDADFFGMEEAEVLACPPEQRMALEVVQQAWEDAGWLPGRLAGSRTGVFVCGGNLALAPGGLGQRLAALYDLRGPTMGVEAGSASVHTGVHLAAQSLQRGECEQALVVAATLLRPGALGRSEQEPGAALDAAAADALWGEGAGCLLLKPLQAAESHGDRVYALVQGSAVAHQGRGSAAAAQAAVLRAAYAAARLPLQSAQYVEAHGYLWSEADRCAARTLSQVLAHGRVAATPVYVGAVESALGHLGVASGMPAFIKVALALWQGSMPATLQGPHPTDLPGLEVVPGGAAVGVASVCGASATGHHAHAVLTAGPPALEVPLGGFSGTRLLPLSAASPAALRALIERHATALEQGALSGDLAAPAGDGFAPETAPLADWCASARLTRAPLPVRAAAIATTRAEMVCALRALQVPSAPPEAAPLLWVLGGVPATPTSPGLELILQQATFRHALEAVEAAVVAAGGPALMAGLRRLGPAFTQASPALAQPAMFAVQVALGRLWSSWGVRPAGLWGRGPGALAAAHLAGALTLDQAARAAWQVGEQLATLARGRESPWPVDGAPATAVPPEDGRLASLAAQAREPWAVAAPRLERASLSAPSLPAVPASEPWAVPTARAAFAPVALAEALRRRLRWLRPQGPTVPLWLGTEAAPVAPEQLDAALFAAEAATPETSGVQPPMAGALLVCLGPADPRLPSALHCLEASSDSAPLWRCLAQLWTRGITPEWEAVDPTPTRRVHLPAYPWQGREWPWEDAAEESVSAGADVSGVSGVSGVSKNATKDPASLH